MYFVEIFTTDSLSLREFLNGIIDLWFVMRFVDFFVHEISWYFNFVFIFHVLNWIFIGFLSILPLNLNDFLNFPWSVFSNVLLFYSLHDFNWKRKKNLILRPENRTCFFNQVYNVSRAMLWVILLLELSLFDLL